MIFQRSLDTGRLPPDWLEANITALFRKGDCHKAENYRPISLTSVPCKILEHIICHHIFCHLETHNFLTNLKLNHSFCTGYSCKAQLTTTVNDFVTSSETTQVDVAVLDFSEAFVVPHGKLLHKTPAVWHWWTATDLAYLFPDWNCERKMLVMLELKGHHQSLHLLIQEYSRALCLALFSFFVIS